MPAGSHQLGHRSGDQTAVQGSGFFFGA